MAKESGGWTAGGAIFTQRSVLDAPAHTKLKYRDFAAAGAVKSRESKESRLQESLRALQNAEREQQKLKNGGGNNSHRWHARHQLRSQEEEAELQERAQQKLLMHTKDKVDLLAIKAKYDDSDVEDDDDEDDTSESNRKDGKTSSTRADTSDLDADDSDLDASSDSDSDSNSDDDDDEAALQAELAKIRAERNACKNKEDEQRMAHELQVQQDAALTGNPLLNINSEVLMSTSSMSKKRSWTDEAVFRGQAKNEPKPVKRFINDTVRNDFHKRFLNKFIR